MADKPHRSFSCPQCGAQFHSFSELRRDPDTVDGALDIIGASARTPTLEDLFTIDDPDSATFGPRLDALARSLLTAVFCELSALSFGDEP